MTTRVLVIMRHGKAEQSESKPDIERLLTKRGHADARVGGEWLVTQGIAPDVVLCSPAQRTRGTWHEVAIGLTSNEQATAPEVVYDRDLYYGGVSTTLDAIRAVDPDAQTVLLIGHNPTVSALSHRLDEASSREVGGLRTSEIAVHTVTTPWADCAAATLTTTFLPRG